MMTPAIGFDVDDVVVALRKAQAAYRASTNYTADAKYLLHVIAEDLIKGIHENNLRFWFKYRKWSADSPDYTDEIMDRVFVSLKINTIDGLAEVLS